MQQGKEIIDFIEDCCFFGDLRYVDDQGNRLDEPVPMALKMETLLQTALQRRCGRIDELKRAGDPRPLAELDNLHFNASDMKHVFNTWRKDVDSWMYDSTLLEYREAETQHKQRAHQIAKQSFSAYLHHISGCKFLLQKLIELPLVRTAADPAESPGGIAMPAELQSLLLAWEKHKQSDEHQAAVQRSAKRKDARLRLSTRIWQAQTAHNRGAMLSKRVREGPKDYFNTLSWQDQQLVEDHDGGRTVRMSIKFFVI